MEGNTVDITFLVVLGIIALAWVVLTAWARSGGRSTWDEMEMALWDAYLVAPSQESQSRQCEAVAQAPSEARRGQGARSPMDDSDVTGPAVVRERACRLTWVQIHRLAVEWRKEDGFG